VLNLIYLQGAWKGQIPWVQVVVELFPPQTWKQRCSVTIHISLSNLKCISLLTKYSHHACHVYYWCHEVELHFGDNTTSSNFKLGCRSSIQMELWVLILLLLRQDNSFQQFCSRNDFSICQIMTASQKSPFPGQQNEITVSLVSNIDANRYFYFHA